MKKSVRKTRIIIAAICAAVLVSATPIVPDTTAAASTMDVSAETGKDYTGIFESGGVMYYVSDGMLTGFTGFVDAGDGTYWYVASGIVCTGLTGFADGEIEGESASWYVRDGKADPGLAGFFDGLYIKDGRRSDVTGLVSGTVDGTEGVWYVADGELQTEYTGFVEDDGAYKYVKDGRFASEKTGAVKGTVDGAEGVYYVTDGIFDGGVTGLAGYGDGWIYIENGKKSAFTGILNAEIDGTSADWYVKDGTVQTQLNDIVTVDGVKYEVKNGQATKYVEPVSESASSSGSTSSKNNSSSGSSSSGSSSSGSSSGSTKTLVTTGFSASGYSTKQKIGTLRIPSVGISVTLYCGSASSVSICQAIVDAKNSACYCPISEDSRYYGISYLADHVNQAFAPLKNVKVGDYLYIDTSSKSYRYKCTEVGTGKWGDTDCYDKNGKGIYAQYNGTDRIFAYTCKGWPTVTYTIWKPE